MNITLPAVSEIRIEPSPDEAAALRRIAVHESGHALLAQEFGLRPVPFIAGPRRGACFHSNGTPRQNAAICWAGILGEDISGCRSPRRRTPAVAPSWATLDQYAASLAVGDVSTADLAGIAQYSPRLEAAALAYQVLFVRRPELEAAADFLAARFGRDFALTCRTASPGQEDLELEGFARALREFECRECATGDGAAAQPSPAFARHSSWVRECREFFGRVMNTGRA